MSEQVKTFIRVYYSLIDKYGLNDGVILSFLLSSKARKGAYLEKALNLSHPTICSKLKEFKEKKLIDDKNNPTQILKDEVKNPNFLMLFDELVKEHKISKAFIISYLISTMIIKDPTTKARKRTFQNIAKVSNISKEQIKRISDELVTAKILALVENKEPSIKQETILAMPLKVANKYNPKLKQGK